MSSIHERIKAARLAKGLSMEALAPLVGVKAYQTVQQWENGSTAPSRKRLERVANVLGTTVEYLLQGIEPGQDGAHAPIPLVDAKTSAGKGELVVSYDTDKVLMFRRDWLAKNDAKPDQTVAFEVRGDSMTDLHIVDGAVVLANRRKTEPRSKRVYVLWIDGELFVKELVRREDAWWARSHNAAKAKAYPDILIDDPAARIVGRAFWCGFGL
ncbi:XRE family transcriptional regulator [Castellaniella ginsengisoli]|uniref:XRE family transcriptional regulator n=1 Tax=Castellaniella ginsengisoli TaxID=546114 RepID=A0AB39D1Z0_9BURK